MPILKEQQIIENTWRFVADEAPIASGDVTVSLKRWLASKSELSNHAGRVGIRIAPGDAIDSIGSELTDIKLIELDFPMFNDGRLFSQARLLRDRYGYSGEIRAVGRFLTDQIYYLSQVGVDAFELFQPRELELASAALKDFTVNYQAAMR